MTSLMPRLRSRFAAAPAALRTVAVLLVLQAIGFIVFGVYETTQLTAGRVATGIVTALMLALWGAVLAFAGWAMLGGRLWARGPVVAAEIVHLPTAWSFRGGETTWVTVVWGLSSLAALVLVLFPASTRYLTGGRAEG